jgi:hypothetical protein
MRSWRASRLLWSFASDVIVPGARDQLAALLAQGSVDR